MKVKMFLVGVFLFISTFATCICAQSVQQTAAYSWTNLPKVSQPTFRRDTFNIISFGAKGDGISLNTESINKAISTCSRKGGGVVLVPGGMWLTGPIEMKSNVNLHIVREAILQFTDDFNQFPLVEGSYEGRRSARCQSPIFGLNLVNIAITGRGIIDGNGDAWRMVKRDKLTESEWKKKVASGGSVSADGNTWFPSSKTRLAHEQKRTSTIAPGQSLNDFEDIKDFLRPNLLVLNNCKKVLLEGVAFQNSPAWCLHPIICEDLTLRNVYVKNPDYAQNGDGVDIESCKNVLIEGSTFDVGDDGICVKSGKDEEGRKRGKPTENVIIRNNVVYKGHGGFVVGSEMSGGARNIFVYDCSFIGTDIGLRFKTARGRGGVVEKIYVKNISMKDIVQDAIFFDMYYFVKAPALNQKVEIPTVTESTPQFRDIEITNIKCNGANKGIFMRGLPEMAVKNIRMEHLVLKVNKGIELIEAKDLRIKDVQLITGIEKPLVYIENSSALTFDSVRYQAGTALLFSINGERSGQIKVLNTDHTKAIKNVEFSNGADENALVVRQ